MIPVGVGTDVVDVARVARLLARKGTRVIERLLTDGERQVGWCEVEILRAPHGEPTLAFHGRAARCVGELSMARALVSLSHSHTQAIAVVLRLA